MKGKTFNEKWTFQYGEPSNIPMMPAKTKEINLPHDFVISKSVSKDARGGAETGFYVGDKGSYTKYIEVTEEDLTKHHELYFDGVAGNTKVVVNGHTVKRHHYAYTPFTVDLDEFLHRGKNRITVTSDTSDEPNSRWYLGGGIYRDVTYYTSEKVYIPADGIFVRTDHIVEKDAFLNVSVEIVNKTAMDKTVALELKTIEKTNPFVSNCKNVDGTEAGNDYVLAVVPAMETTTIEGKIRIENVHLWDIDSPELYSITAEVFELPEIHDYAKKHRDNSIEENSGKVLDIANTIFGVRSITIDQVNGFRLNGRTEKLKGGCIHHDNGLLGAAAFKEAEYRKVLLHKKAGFNALRFAHNPMSKHLLDACDMLGILVFNEAFDVWNMEKDTFDFSNYFENDWEKELTAFMRRDRNHPSVFAWSIGNEIPNMGGLSGGYKISTMLSQKARALDNTRPIGGALCSFFRGLDDEDNKAYWDDVTSNTEELKKNGAVNLDCKFGRDIWPYYTAPFVNTWDIVGYNYLAYQYEKTHNLFKNRVIVCSESKPREIAKYWQEVLRLPYVIGDFEWTSMDYIGEAGIGQRAYVDESLADETQMKMNYTSYPIRLAGAGDFDICGTEKPQLYYRKAVLKEKDTYIVVHNPLNKDKTEILGRYAWPDCKHCYTLDMPENSALSIDVYSAAYEVELFINERSFGRRLAGIDNNVTAHFEIEYEPGTLKAISYDANGNEVSSDVLKTAGVFAGYKVVMDQALETISEKLGEEKSNLYYFYIQKVDNQNKPLGYGEEKIKVTVENGTLLGLGTGRMSTEEIYTSNETTLYEGVAQIIVQATSDALPLVHVEKV